MSRLTINHQFHQGDSLEVLRELPDASVHCCITSPPYWNLRDYGTEGQIGLEETPEAYVSRLVDVFREVRRVLRDDGVIWVNLGDSYAGSGKGAANYPGDYPKQNSNKGALSVKGTAGFVPPGLKPKDLVGIPWLVAFALRADGWYLRSDIIWAKSNPMPESVTDRPTKAHEYIFLLSKNAKYYYDHIAIAEKTVDAEAIKCYNRGRQKGVLADEEMHEMQSRTGHIDVQQGQEVEGWPEDMVQDVRGGVCQTMGADREGESVKGKSGSEVQSLKTRQSKKVGLQPQFRSDEASKGELAEVTRRAGVFKEVSAIGKEKSCSEKILRERQRQSDNRQVSCNREGEGVPSSGDTQTEIVAEGRDQRSNSGTMARDTRQAESPMCNVRGKSETDKGSHNTLEQRRSSYSGQYSGIVSQLQCQKGEQVTPKRNKRSVWEVATQPYKGSHFAIFPEKLIEPCILAGTSEKACPKCGAPWERVTEKERTFESGSGRSGNLPVGKNGPGLQGGGATVDIRRGPVVHTTTIGFQPACTCPDNDGSGACVVLDPFGGSGTVSLVAKRLGRGSIYIDLNPEYLQMALKRMGNQETLFEQHRIEVKP